MVEKLLLPRKVLNKAYLKVRPARAAIEAFKHNLLALLDDLDETESEEHNKNDLAGFLRNTFYQPKFYINTKDRADLVIHNGPDAKNSPGVLFEVKKPSNKAEMVQITNLRAKAFYELILYYMRERISNNNLEVRHLVATNVYEWFLFDAADFDRVFARDKSFVRQFTEFEAGRLAGTSTDFFYFDVAAPFVEKLEEEFPFTWFDIRDYEKVLRNADRSDDAKLISLYKVLSPEHLLKLPFANDSNTLDKSFYAELLHIIGLSETKSGSKKVIERKKEGQRDPGSLLENTILQLDTRDKISRLPKPAVYGENTQERLFNVALELVITWLNRILFLKLLEAQLMRYHKGDPSFGFLNESRVGGFDALDNLFFRVLARKLEERDTEAATAFRRIPYLNSSLFEPTELEQLTIFISNLQDSAQIPIASSTVLKEGNGKKRSGKLGGLEYLFQFLDAYDFAGEGSEEIQEENKTLINASVLGLIFEKINGYRDGSFFTPGFITMYMCRETIRRAVVQKFNEANGWSCETIGDLYDKVEDRGEANRIINSLRICDPAVGSGHFLVSALNEIIALKSDLRILSDRNGRRLKEYRVEVANDELVVTDEEGDLFEYIPGNNESQRVQEALFHEKQTIIENCLFGVDINPNSVKICRLRLWIELLKNAYYKTYSPHHQLTNSQTHQLTTSPGEGELETLPNIDINIKCGNSLISRYALDADIRQALKKSKWSIESYRLAVMSYRNATEKEQKREMERLIQTIKSDFETEVSANDKRRVKLRTLQGDLFNLTQQTSLFERSKKELADWNKKIENLASGIRHLESDLEEIKNNKIYENAFEWRFEFPEVLNDEGDFVGFDVVIGNPPYGIKFSIKEKQIFSERFSTIDDVYSVFIELGLLLIRKNGQSSLIIPIFWLTGENYIKTRKMLIIKGSLEKAVVLPYNIFLDAYIDTGIFIFSSIKEDYFSEIHEFNPKEEIDFLKLNSINFDFLHTSDWVKDEKCKIVINPLSRSISSKMRSNGRKVSEITDSARGILANPEDYSESSITSEYKPILIGPVNRYNYQRIFSFIKYGDNLKEKPSSATIFEGERLLIRRIVNRQFRLMATIAKDSFINKKDIYIFKTKEPEFSLHLILGIVNSKLVSYFITKGTTSAKKDDFTQITLNDIRNLSIPERNIDLTKKIEILVEEVLSMKQKSLSSNCDSIESQIDRLVYELYGLTEEEIGIVEGKE
jgi:adenine-specific DNA-methyltransferase